MSQTPIHILWNRHAGSAAANQDVLSELLSRSDITVHQPESDAQASTLASQLSTEGAEIVVAAGGDGTVNAVVQGLMQAGAKSRLAILPLGTGNDFCRTIAIPDDIRQAADLIETGQTRRIDVIRSETGGNTTYYVNMATGGNTGQFMERLTDEMKQFWGPLVYLRGVVDVLSELIQFDLTVQFNERQPEEFAALNVFAANGRTSGTGLQVAPDASLEDGLLDVIIIRDCEPVQMAGLATDFALSDYRQNENVIYRRAAKLTIASKPPMAFTADGNLLTKHAVEFVVCPGALGVIVGPDYVVSPETDNPL